MNLPNSLARRGFSVLLGALLLMAFPLVAQNQPSAPVENPPAAASTPEVSVVKSASGEDPAGAPQTAQSSFQGASGQTFGAANGDYVLKPGDTIEMVVFREQDLTIRSRVGKDGMVQLPLLGEVHLGGMTIRNATQLVRQKYNADYLVEPQIYLNIAAYNTRKFTIIGQVGKPGAYEFGGGEDLDLLEAIGMAGGFTRIADRGHVLVKRREGGTVKTMKVNAKKLADSATDRFEIQPGDVITVGESWY